MAPARVAPQKAMIHSGRLRMMMATRSPWAIPKRGAEPLRERAGDAVVLGEGRPLVLVHEEGGITVGERHVEDGAQGRRCVLPGPGRHAADVELLHLEELPGAVRASVGLGDRHRGRVLAGCAHVVSFSVVPARSKMAAR